MLPVPNTSTRSFRRRSLAGRLRRTICCTVSPRHFLPKYLVLPFVTAAAVSVFVSTRVGEPWKGLTVNMAAAFLGSIVTVFYVDVILRRNQEARWARVRSKVFIRLERVSNATISSVRSAFGVQPPDALALDPMNLALMRREILQLAEQTLRPALFGIEKMNQRDWKILAANLQGSVQEIDRLLTLFWRSLDADYTLLLLQIQENALAILTSYSIFPDIFGVPKESLPRKLDGSSSVPIQRAQYQLASDDVEKLLSTCSRLLRALPPHQE